MLFQLTVLSCNNFSNPVSAVNSFHPAGIWGLNMQHDVMLDSDSWLHEWCSINLCMIVIISIIHYRSESDNLEDTI